MSQQSESFIKHVRFIEENQNKVNNSLNMSDS